MTQSQGTELIQKTKKTRVAIFTLYIIIQAIPIILFAILLISIVNSTAVETWVLLITCLSTYFAFWIAMWALLYKAIRVLKATNDVYKLRKDVQSLVILFAVYVGFSFLNIIFTSIASLVTLAQPVYAITVAIIVITLILTILQFGLIIVSIVLPALILKKIPEQKIVRAVIVNDESQTEKENRELKEELMRLKNEKMKKEIKKLKSEK